MVDNKKMTGMLIHGFAAAHAITAMALAQTVIGDEAALTSLTVAMIMAVARMNGAGWNSGDALAFLGIYVGGYVGVRGATFLVKWVPGLGNGINAIVTAVTTELLGWATYALVQKCQRNPKAAFDPKTMTESEKRALWEEARNLREEEKKASKYLYDSMSKEDRDKYDSIVKRLRSRRLSEEERIALIDELESLLTAVNEKNR